jgi:hypothetical protein
MHFLHKYDHNMITILKMVGIIKTTAQKRRGHVHRQQGTRDRCELREGSIYRGLLSGTEDDQAYRDVAVKRACRSNGGVDC